MKRIYLVLIVFFLLKHGFTQSFTPIPSLTFEPTESTPSIRLDSITTVHAFYLSSFITLGEYKIYLEDIKADSSEAFYRSQFPDSNITIYDDVYTTYITDKKYEDDPALGISWYNAMNYCRWLTLNDPDNTDSIVVLYRLPDVYEYLSAKSFSSVLCSDPLNEKPYECWLMNDFDQSAYQFFQVDYVPYISYPDTTLPEVIQRKITAGSSFLYNNAFCRLFGGFYYYAFFGYRHISFRIIRSEINKEDINPIDELVLKHWKLYE